MATPQASAPLLHRFLGIGQVILAAVFLVLRYLGLSPLIEPDQTAALIGNVMAAVGFAVLAVALLVMRPGVPGRRPEQSVEQYWSTPDVAMKALRVWFLMEGAAVMSAVGVLITSQPAPIVVMGLAIAVFWVSGPAALAKA